VSPKPAKSLDSPTLNKKQREPLLKHKESLPGEKRKQSNHPVLKSKQLSLLPSNSKNLKKTANSSQSKAAVPATAQPSSPTST
jgi:hypothetical protein